MESSRARKPEEQSSTLCHRKCSRNMKPEVSTTVGGAGNVRWTPSDPLETNRFQWNLRKSSRSYDETGSVNNS